MKHAHVDFDYSSTCGIPGVTFNGVDQYTCLNCENVIHDLGEEQAINDAITDILLGADLIPRRAVKFLRTEVFRESIFEFAARIKTSPQHLKDIEASKKILSEDLSQKIQDEIIRHRAMDVKIVFDV